MTAQQQELFNSAQHLMKMVNDDGLSPQVRGAAYYRMMDLRAILEDEYHIQTTIIYGQIAVVRQEYA